MISKISSNFKFQPKSDTVTGSEGNTETATAAKQVSKTHGGETRMVSALSQVSLQYASMEITGWEPLLKSLKAGLSIYPDIPQGYAVE